MLDRKRTRRSSARRIQDDRLPCAQAGGGRYHERYFFLPLLIPHPLFLFPLSSLIIITTTTSTSTTTRRLPRPGAQASHLHEPLHGFALAADRRGQRKDLPRLHQARYAAPRDADVRLPRQDGDAHGPRRAQGEAQEGAQSPVHQDTVQEVGDMSLLFERRGIPSFLNLLFFHLPFFPFEINKYNLSF